MLGTLAERFGNGTFNSLISVELREQFVLLFTVQINELLQVKIMKRQLMALGLLTVSVMPVLAVHSPAAAATKTVKEIEGRFRNIGPLATNFDQYLLTGSLGRNDTKDNFIFSIPEQRKLTFVFGADAAIRNGRLTISNGARIIQSIAPGGSPTVVSLAQGTYRIDIEGETTSSDPEYQARILTPAIKSRTVNVDLISAQGRDRFDRLPGKRSRPDFFVETSMDNVRKQNTKVHRDNNTPTFSHRVSHTVKDNIVLIKLRLADSDTGTSGQTADINPATPDKGITLRYIPTTGKIFNTSDNKVVGRKGVPFSLAGTNGPKATLNLKINHTVNQ